MTRPHATEHNPYFGKYISLVPGDNIIAVLGDQIDTTLTMLRGLTESQGDVRYAPGKWSIKEVVGHLIDSERVFAYRAMRIARNDQTPLAGFDENDYVANSNFSARELRDLTDEFETVRKANLYLLKHLDQGAWMRRGIANDAEISVRALAYVIAGHELHHLGVIRERYL